MLGVGLLENCLFTLAGCADGQRSYLGIVNFRGSFPYISPAWQSRATEKPERPLCEPRATRSRERAAPLPFAPLNPTHHPVTADPGSDPSNK